MQALDARGSWPPSYAVTFYTGPRPMEIIDTVNALFDDTAGADEDSNADSNAVECPDWFQRTAPLVSTAGGKRVPLVWVGHCSMLVAFVGIGGGVGIELGVGIGVGPGFGDRARVRAWVRARPRARG